MKNYLLIYFLLIFLSGCVTNQTPQRDFYNQPDQLPVYDDNIEIKSLGSLSGTALGSQIGKYLQIMNQTDKQTLGNIFNTQQSGLTRRWHNAEHDIVYAVTPTRSHQYSDGSICREYVVELLKGNDIQEYYGRACKQNDNSWVIVN